MLDLKPVSIPVCLRSRASITALKLVSIAQREVTHIKLQRHRNNQAILGPSPALERLRGDGPVMRRNRDVFSESKSKSHTNALFDRMTYVSAQPEVAQDVEIDRARDRRGQLHFRPLLVVAAQLCAGIMGRKEAQKAQEMDQFCLCHQLRRLCGGSTVNEASPTTTLSPTCNRVALASGLGRVAMITFVLWRSGVSVVR